MNLCTCFLLFRIFAYTNSSPPNTPNEDKEGTDLALKGVLELNDKENSKNVSAAINETVIDENKIPQPDFRATTVGTFTEFIQELVNILNSYEDAAFAIFFDTLDEEIKKHHHSCCKVYELTENNEFKSLLAKKLDLIKKKSFPILKAEINKVAAIIKHETYNKHVKKLLNYINSLYREDAGEKFRKVLTDLIVYGNSTSEKPKSYLVKIIRDGVRAIVFNHFADLNINVTRELKNEIATFLKKIKEAPPSSSSKINLFPDKPAVRESENTAKISRYNIAIEDENREHYSKVNSTSTTDNSDISTLKTSDEKKQDDATKLEISKEESNSQQLQKTYQSTDESSDDETIEGNSTEWSQERQQEFSSQTYDTLYNEESSDKTTEKQEIIYKSDLKSKLVRRMLREESTGKLPTTTSGLRSDDILRRCVAAPLPEEELSIDVFDRVERKRQKYLAKSNRIVTVQLGMKDTIKRMRNLQNKINQIQKIDEYKQTSTINAIRNGYIVRNVVDDSDAKKSKNKVREPKRFVKKTNPEVEGELDIESNKEIVKKYDMYVNKLKNKKKTARSDTKKVTKSAKTVKSAKIPVHNPLEPPPTVKNNAGNTTVDNDKRISKTTFAITKKVGNAPLNVTEEVKQKRINNTANDDYATKHNPTLRYRRVLEFSSPPLYDQPFGNYKFQDELHPANMSD